MFGILAYAKQKALDTFEESNGHDQSAGHWHNSVRIRLHEDERRVGKLLTFSTFSYFFHQASGLRCLCARRCNRPLGEWLQPRDRDDRMYTSHYQRRSRHLLINPNLDVLGILLNILARAFCQDDPGCIHLDKFGFVLCCLIWRTGADYSLSCTIVCVLKFFRGFVDSRVQYTQPSPQLDSSLLRNRFA